MNRYLTLSATLRVPNQLSPSTLAMPSTLTVEVRLFELGSHSQATGDGSRDDSHLETRLESRLSRQLV